MNDEIITSYLLGKKAGGGGTPPVYQDKEVSITQNGTSTITKDSGYDALNSVELTVAVPQPSGKITITQNGTDIDVSSYASADVNVPAGADLSEYFESTIPNVSYPSYKNIFKKIPKLTATGTSIQNMFQSYDLPAPIPDIDASTITNMNECFKNCKLNKIDLSGWIFPTNISYFGSVFQYCTATEIDLSSLGVCNRASFSCNNLFQYCASLKKVNLCNWVREDYTNLNAGGLFSNCTSLEEVDMSSFDFSKVASNMISSMFSGVPTNCLILVKDQTQKNWFTTNWPSLTNVQIKSEYIANQGA